MSNSLLNLSDVLQEAKRLAPCSLRLRASLQVLLHSLGRLEAMGPEQVRKLAQLVEEVREGIEPLPEPTTYGGALKVMVNRPFLATWKHREQHLRANRVGAHPDILAFERAFVARFKRVGVPMWAHSVVRDEAEQNRLYVTGVSLATAGKSPHNHGLAVDLVHGTLAWNLPKSSWEIVGHVGLEVAAQLGVKLEWGGTWRRFYDPAHWELSDWRSRVLIAKGP